MLTDSDHEWLKLNKQRLESWTQLFVAQLCAAPERRLMEIAGDILVVQRGRFIRAGDLVTTAVATTKSSQIFEVWNYSLACSLHTISRQYSSEDARAILIAGGFHNADLDELAQWAWVAASEARHELYGE
jgi:hypothetical protein